MSNCLKCGKETINDAAFCTECVAGMDKYPVKPDAVARLLPRPKRPEYTPPEAFNEAVEKEKLAAAKRTIRLLSVLLLILSILLMLATGTLLYSLKEKPETLPIGRNYSTTHQQP